MQDLSYHIQEPIFEFHHWKFGFRIYTFENVYTLNSEKCILKKSNRTLSILCTQLNYAGNRLHANGCFEALITGTSEGINISTTCSLGLKIRNIKLSIYNLPLGDIISLREGIAPIPSDGCTYTYPSGWRGLYTPLVIIKELHNQQSFYYFRSLDCQVREKRFVFLPTAKTMTAELIHEETGRNMATSVCVPDWEIGICQTPDKIYEKQQQHIETCYQIPHWENRPDVPDWMHKIALVASIHMEHWTGYTFHTYKKVTEIAQWLRQRINPQHVLLYLPGWDGRYYWNYGNYAPSDSMGGEEAFRNMMKEVKSMGFHVMLMVGMNMAARHIDNFEQWGSSSFSVNVSGIPQYTLVDWDGSRHYLHNFNAMLNIGAPNWQHKITDEIVRLYKEYNYDAMFLDISAAWINEQLFDNYTGIRSFMNTLHQELPSNVLIAGEGWYDGLGAVTPLMQSGHTDGKLHWHDEPCADLYTPYCRSFGHLCLGDPSSGSTGVHELGYNSIQTVPYRKGILQTITFTETTLAEAAEQVEAMIETAKQYVREFL